MRIHAIYVFKRKDDALPAFASNTVRDPEVPVVSNTYLTSMRSISGSLSTTCGSLSLIVLSYTRYLIARLCAGFSSKQRTISLEEKVFRTFIHDPSESDSGEYDDLPKLDLLAWFAVDEGATMPACHLLDLLAATTSERLSLSSSVGAKLLDEFGSIGAVLAADSERLFRCLRAEDRSDWAIEQLHWRLKITSALMRRALAEKVRKRQVINSGEILIKYLKMTMGNNTTEHLRVIYLDKKNALIRDEIQNKGTVDHVALYPREILKRSLELGACAIVIAHNHPSGDPRPSRADIEMTKKIRVALENVDIVLHDHIIITSDKYISFNSEGIL